MMGKALWFAGGLISVPLLFLSIYILAVNRVEPPPIEFFIGMVIGGVCFIWLLSKFIP